MTLKPEDYLEPECVICDKPVGYEKPVSRIPQQRISQKLDELMAQKKTSEAERMLLYWAEEAEKGNDRQGLFMVRNEMMGYYRKIADKQKAYQAVEQALSMLDELGYRDSISGATCYTNAATVYTAFEKPEKSLELFEKARVIYENNRQNNEFKLAGLYNNMAIALAATGQYARADELYHKALELLDTVENGQLEQAMTWLNMLDAVISEKGYDVNNEELYSSYLTRAMEYLDTESLPRDGYYSFVADKCVGIFDNFGWFRYAAKLRERIKEIDERA